MKRDGKIKENFLIGKFLKKTHPELAKEIADTYIYPPSPLNDYGLIPGFYDQFKEIAHDYKWNSKQLFISCIIRLYNPQLYNQPTSSLLVRSKLVIQLTRIMGIDRGNVSRYIRTGVVQETAYEEYKQMVDEVVKKIFPDAD